MIKPTFIGLTMTGLLSLASMHGQSPLTISEIMYNPAEPSEAEGKDGFDDADEFEFIELMNVSDQVVNLDTLAFTKGIDYTFSSEFILKPDERCVLVRNRGGFQKRYGNVARVAGNYDGSLKNGGEKVTLSDADKEVLATVSYKDDHPWPQGADGAGFSIVQKAPKANNALNLAKSWQASNAIGGSPGKGDQISEGGIVINEILAHTDLPNVDAIELYNPTDKDIDVGGWFLTDDFDEPKKYPIVSGSKVPAGGYLVVKGDNDDLSDNNTDLPADRYARAFSLSSHGEEVHLFAANAKGTLTGYSHGFSFKATQNGVSVGRHVNSANKEQFPMQRSMTLGQANAGPAVPEVVISEIHYHPFAENDEEEEFVEIWNRGKRSIPLYDPKMPANTWQLSGAKLFNFPSNQTLKTNEVALVTRTDPATFRRRNKIPESVKIFGPLDGALSNKGERLTLLRPDTPDVTSEETVVPMLRVDSVHYNDKDPWPEDADGIGASLERLPEADYSDDPKSWKSSSKDKGTPGAAPESSTASPAH